MTKITLNGSDYNLVPLTWGQVKANNDVLDKMSTEGLPFRKRTEASEALLKVSMPDLDLEPLSPGAIMLLGVELYLLTFKRPEDEAPVPQNP